MRNASAESAWMRKNPPSASSVFGDRHDRYPTISPNELAAAAPDVVLLSTEPFPFKPAHADELTEAAGIPRDRMQIVDGELLSWHGSRTPAGIDYAEQIMTATGEGTRSG